MSQRRRNRKVIASALEKNGVPLGGLGITASLAELNLADTVTSGAAELNLLDGSSEANAAASVAAVLDANKQLQTAAHNGTPETGVAATHYGDGINITAVLELTDLPLTVGSSENLAVGALAYTLPAGNITILEAFMSLEITGVTTTTDTPDVGLGTVIASGIVVVLGGTATFEDIITGQTATDTNGTPIIADATPGLNILTAGAHTVHVNAADGWGANADAAGLVNGTIVLKYRYNAA